MAEKTNRNGLYLEDVYITGILRTKLESAPLNIADLQFKPEAKYDELVLHLGENGNAKLTIALLWRYQRQRLLNETNIKFKSTGSL